MILAASAAASDEASLTTRLREIVCGTGWLLEALREARGLGLPDWCVGAGAVRNAVWDSLSGHTTPSALSDVDVVYFDPRDLTQERDDELASRLARSCPRFTWDVTNQAGVHLWYEAEYGVAVSPLTSTLEAISTWPETATCVGVRLTDGEEVDVLAPLGLVDLFDLVVRRNPARVTPEEYLRRLEKKQYALRWPRVAILQEDS